VKTSKGKTASKKVAKKKAAPRKVTATTKTPAKRGRPRKEFDLEQVAGMAAIGCSDDEIAGVLSISEGLLRTRGREALNRGRAGMRVSLRRLQLKAAADGNSSMLIWLGKMYLGQRDPRYEIKIDQRTEIVDAREEASEQFMDHILREIGAHAKRLDS